jgi:hypothetical protein
LGVVTLFWEATVFGKSMPPPSSWSKSKSKQEPGRRRHAAWFLAWTGLSLWWWRLHIHLKCWAPSELHGIKI